MFWPISSNMLLVFWMAALALVFAYAGYPWIIITAAKWIPSRGRVFGPVPTSLSVVVAAKNEEGRIASRIQNLLSCTWTGMREIIVSCDGCTDGTASLARQTGAQIVLELRACGKPSALNAAVAAATGELIVFTDARQEFAPDALEELALAFSDPSVGAASGALTIKSADHATSAGLDRYWSLEKRLRLAEAQIDSAIGCTGAIYAIRRDLFRPLPPDTILDDVVTPMQIAESGHRVLFLPDARAFDPQPLGAPQERRRKQRTLEGNLQTMLRHPSWWLPGGHRLWFQFFGHKVLRLLGPLILLVLFISSALAALSQPWGRWALGFQVAGYAYAAAAIKFPKSMGRLPLASAAGAFLFLQQSLAAALWHGCKRPDKYAKGW